MGREVAARSMLGRPSEFDPAPFFFTDQYDLLMEYAGWADARQAQTTTPQASGPGSRTARAIDRHEDDR